MSDDTPPRTRAVSVLCAISILLLTSLFGEPVWSHESDPPAVFGVSLLSYNVRVDFDGGSWPRRNAAIARVLKTADADIVAIQEASEFMLGEYHALLPGYNYVVGERSDGHRGDQGWYEYLPIYYRPNKLALIDSGSFWVADNPAEPGSSLSGSKPAGRVLTWMTLQARLTGDQFVVANVHIHGEAAERAIKIIRSELAARAGLLPTILAGDFNSTPDTMAYARLMDVFEVALPVSEKPDEDAVEHVATFIGAGESVPSGPDTSKKGHTSRTLDYIFYQSPIGISEAAILDSRIEKGVYGSDHFPILAKMTLPLANEPTQEPRSTLDANDVEDDVMVVAHRACWDTEPENSIPAIQRCVEKGVHVVEIDVRATKDGELVLMHDESVDRTTTGSGLLAELSLEELNALSLLTRDGREDAMPTNLMAPTLRQALLATRNRILVNLDLKDKGLHEQALAVAEETGTHRQVILKSADPADVAIGSFAEVSQTSNFMPIIRVNGGVTVDQLADYGPLNPFAYEVLIGDPALLDRFCGEDLGSHYRIWINTLSPNHAGGIMDKSAISDSASTWGRVIACGASMIQTDYPIDLLVYLQSAESTSDVEN